jgi:hypothetical protein
VGLLDDGGHHRARRQHPRHDRPRLGELVAVWSAVLALLTATAVVTLGLVVLLLARLDPRPR